MNDLLTDDQVRAAMAKLLATWPGKSMPDGQAADWRRLLGKLHQGEFTPALDAWLESPEARFRPTLPEFMSVVASRRPSPKPRYFEPTDDPEALDWPGQLEQLAKVRRIAG